MELDELYQQVILDHAKRPRNRRELPECTAMAMGENPSCGDEVTVFVKLSPDGKIAETTFMGNGCAISQAAASILTTQLAGKTRDEPAQLIHTYHASLGSDGESYDEDESLGHDAELGGGRKFPQRGRCATVPSHALEET